MRPAKATRPDDLPLIKFFSRNKIDRHTCRNASIQKHEQHASIHPDLRIPAIPTATTVSNECFTYRAPTAPLSDNPVKSLTHINFPAKERSNSLYKLGKNDVLV